MSRRSRRAARTSAHAPVFGGAYESVESRPDGDWQVRRLTGSSSAKSYRCPGCEQMIPPSTPHVVAWPVERTFLGGGPEDRRHWHSGCWSRFARAPR